MMLIPSSTRSLLLPTAPPFARRRGLRCAVANLLAQIRGARDLDQPFGDDGLQPAIAAWHRQADQVAAQVDDALCFRLEELGRRAAQLVGLLQQHEATLAQRIDTLDRARAGDQDEHTVAGSDNLRLIRSTGSAIDNERATLAQVSKDLREVVQAQHHLRRAAADVAASWSRRCDELGALHRRGFHLRQARAKAGDPGSAPPLPSHHSRYDWASTMESPDERT